jgi:hypothetical protein
MFTARNLIIDDNSLIGEICNVVHCGFPLMSNMEMAFPALFTDSKKKEMRGVKVGDMNRYLGGELSFDHTLLHADGYIFKSGWYFGRESAQKCVVTVTACFTEDVDCQDRHAMQRLIRYRKIKD